MVQTVSAATHLFFNHLRAAAFASALLVAAVACTDARAADPLVVVGTNWSGLTGAHLTAFPILDGDGLKGVTFMRKRFTLSDISSSGGAVLFEVESMAGKKRVFKLKKGWPKNLQEKTENPEMDTAREVLGPTGGFVTLSYLEQGGVFSDKYRHLRLQVKCKGSECKLFLADGSPVERLFAFKAENDRGIREVRVVTRGMYANLTGNDFPGSSPAVAQNIEKGRSKSVGGPSWSVDEQDQLAVRSERAN